MYTKPNPNHSMTIKNAPPSFFEKIFSKLTYSFLRQFTQEPLTLALPNGFQWIFGSGDKKPVNIKCKNYKIFKKMVLRGDVGFGESYVDGDWETEDLTETLAYFARNINHINKKSWSSKLARIFYKINHFLNRNTYKGSQKNIEAHYDLSNEMFQLFLDPTMMYSSGYFKNSKTTLDQSQIEKNNMIIRKAGIQKNHHILEIGSGWGGFAIHAVKETGCKVTTITLSKKQYELAVERVKEAGLQNNINVKFIDYRDMDGSFDHIVSIEMLEAVGHKFYGTFFNQLDNLLKPGGKAVIQVITIPDQRYDEYRSNPDWIQKYIFPGGMCPSLTEISFAMTKNSKLNIEHLENIGPHYAKTLKEWRNKFEAQQDTLLKMNYDDKFIRMWRYYFCYCEAGFQEFIINNLQLVLKRAGEGV